MSSGGNLTGGLKTIFGSNTRRLGDRDARSTAAKSGVGITVYNEQIGAAKGRHGEMETTGTAAGIRYDNSGAVVYSGTVPATTTPVDRNRVNFPKSRTLEH